MFAILQELRHQVHFRKQTRRLGTMQPRRCAIFKYKQKCILLFFIILLTLTVVYKQLKSTWPQFINPYAGMSCILPTLDPFDPVIKGYMWDLDPLVCSSAPSLLFLDDLGRIQYNITALNDLKLQESDLHCQYEILERHFYEEQVTFTSAVKLSPPYKVDADFFYVSCTNHDKLPVFNELFSSISKRKDLSTIKLNSESKGQLNVLLFGIDATSRSHSIRKLPKTVKYITETLGAYDFEGYMKVGSNTFPNLVPVLTGRHAYSSELPVNNYIKNPIDKFPFLWKDYSSKGYATMYAEDLFKFSTFKYAIKGFHSQPTDHYMVPFWQSLAEIVETKSYTKSVKSEFLNRANSLLCYKNKPKHMIQINYLRQFFKSYEQERKFAFVFFNYISHDYHNFLGYADEDLKHLFQEFKSEGYLDNTVIMLFSDHGIRNEEFSYTPAGILEERMPMLYVVMPEHIRNQYPALDKSMALNTQILSTPFDLHQTLVDVLNQNFDAPSEYFVGGSLRGISLFRPLPSARSCADANIPENYCACYMSSPVNVTQDKFIASIAAAMVRHINARLSNEPLCAELHLLHIENANLISRGLKEIETKNTKSSFFKLFRRETVDLLRYEIVIRTTPGLGAFAGTANINPETGIATVIGDTSRLNRYGNQSICIQDRLLRPMCFCKDQMLS